MSKAMKTQEFIEVVAAEMSVRVGVAVESWMSQVEHALCDPRLTTLGRMSAAKAVLDRYKSLQDKATLENRGLVA